MELTPFHLAIPVSNLSECRDFYTNTLNLEEGRCSDHWVDYNFFGHNWLFITNQKEKKIRIPMP